MSNQRPAILLLLVASACGGIAVLPDEGDADGAGGADLGDTSSSVTPVGSGPSVASSAGAGPTSAASGTGGGGGSGEGDCATAPCVLAAGFVGQDLALLGERVVVTTGDQGQVVSVPRRGGTLEVVADGDAWAGSLAVDGDTVFWAGENSLFRVPSAGGAATVVATPGLPLGAIAIDGADLYFVDRQAFGSIRAVAAVGGEPRVVVAYASLANDLAFERGIKNWDTLFWVSSDAAVGELHALVLDGSSEPTTLLGSMDTPGAILHASEGTYVTEPYAGIVSRVGPSGIGEFLLGTVDVPAGLAIDDTWVYVTELGTSSSRSGRILRMGRFEATGVEVVAEGLRAPIGIVADDEAIYWLESDPERSLMRLTKPGR